MKYIRITFVLSLLLLSIACNQSKNQFTLSGEIKKSSNDYVKLFKINLKDQELVDTVKTDTEGKYFIEAEITEASFYKLEFGSQYITLIIKPGDNIEVTANAEHFGTEYVVHGSADSKAIHTLIERQTETLEQITLLSEDYNAQMIARERSVEDIKTDANNRYDEIVSRHKNFTISFIEKNLTSLAGLMALYQYLGPKSTVFNPHDNEEDLALFEKVDSALRTRYPENEAVKSLNSDIVKMKKFKESEAFMEQQFQIGAVPPEIALPNPDGDTLTLSSFKGKYVLLDFWAAWCPPCREENPTLVKAYKMFSDKGFDIFQVSLDQSREAWLEAIETDNLTWHHASDLKYWNSIVVKSYNLDGIPTNFLLDTEGKIIARDLRGPTLIATLKDLLN